MYICDNDACAERGFNDSEKTLRPIFGLNSYLNADRICPFTLQYFKPRVVRLRNGRKTKANILLYS